MALVEGLRAQARQSFLSVTRVLEAHRLDASAIVGGLCYVRRASDAVLVSS